MRHMVLVLGLAVAGCAGTGQAMKDSMNGGPEADVARIEQGQGWSCYLASNTTWSGCWRTNEACAGELESNKKAAQSQGDSGITFGPCQPAMQASCVTYGVMTMQSDGSAKPEPKWDCMPDPSTCQAFADNLKRDSKNMQVSRCALVK